MRAFINRASSRAFASSSVARVMGKRAFSAAPHDAHAQKYITSPHYAYRGPDSNFVPFHEFAKDPVFPKDQFHESYFKFEVNVGKPDGHQRYSPASGLAFSLDTDPALQEVAGEYAAKKYWGSKTGLATYATIFATFLCYEFFMWGGYQKPHDMVWNDLFEINLRSMAHQLQWEKSWDEMRKVPMSEVIETIEKRPYYRKNPYHLTPADIALTPEEVKELTPAQQRQYLEARYGAEKANAIMKHYADAKAAQHVVKSLKDRLDDLQNDKTLSIVHRKALKLEVNRQILNLINRPNALGLTLPFEETAASYSVQDIAAFTISPFADIPALTGGILPQTSVVKYTVASTLLKLQNGEIEEDKIPDMLRSLFVLQYGTEFFENLYTVAKIRHLPLLRLFVPSPASLVRYTANAPLLASYLALLEKEQIPLPNVLSETWLVRNKFLPEQTPREALPALREYIKEGGIPELARFFGYDLALAADDKLYLGFSVPQYNPAPEDELSEEELETKNQALSYLDETNHLFITARPDFDNDRPHQQVLDQWRVDIREQLEQISSAARAVADKRTKFLLSVQDKNALDYLVNVDGLTPGSIAPVASKVVAQVAAAVHEAVAPVVAAVVPEQDATAPESPQ